MSSQKHHVARSLSTCTESAVLDVLREQLGPFNFVATAGLSLGEFTAHAAAGTFDFLTGLRLVAHRGQYMEEACRIDFGHHGCVYWS